MSHLHNASIKNVPSASAVIVHATRKLLQNQLDDLTHDITHEPIDAVTVAKARLGTLDTRAIAQQNVTKNAFTDSREQSEMEAAFDRHALTKNLLDTRFPIRALKSVKTTDELREIHWTEHEGRPPLHSFNAHNEHEGQLNWLQVGTQFQCCHTFSRCRSMAASPTNGDVESLNKLARQIKSQSAEL